MKLALFFLIAFVGSMTAIVFVYGKGHSYLSNDSRACANCHIMQDTYDSWVKSSHHHVTGCNSCHVPQNPLMKWPVKALNGLHHSFAFTFQELPAVIQASSLSGDVVAQNCLRCHGDFVQKSTPHSLEMRSCLSCHAHVGHEHR